MVEIHLNIPGDGIERLEEAAKEAGLTAQEFLRQKLTAGTKLDIPWVYVSDPPKKKEGSEEETEGQ